MLAGLRTRHTDVTNKHDVGFRMRTEHSENLAVVRELNVIDCIRAEIRNLMAPGSIHWLEPQIVNPLVANGINDCLCVWRKARIPRNARIGIEYTPLRFLPRVQIY